MKKKMICAALLILEKVTNVLYDKICETKFEKHDGLLKSEFLKCCDALANTISYVESQVYPNRHTL